MEMEFEWNDNKNQRNIAKHGIDFETASRIFEGVIFAEPATTHGGSEARIKCFGKIEDVTIVVIFTVRDRKLRIISARPAKRKERKSYEEALQQTADTGGIESDPR